MAITSTSLGDMHGGALPKRKKKASAKHTGSEEMDAPSLMKEMAKLHKGKGSKKKSATKKKVAKHHKKKAS